MATRTVVILGRRPSVRWTDVLSRLHKGEELVVLSLGYPVTSGQRAALFRAEQVAAEAGVRFDAQLVTTVSQTLAALEPEDEVQLAARGRVGRSLRVALAGAAASC